VSVRVGVLASGRGSNFAALAKAAASGRIGAQLACLITDNPACGALVVASQYGIPAQIVDPGPRRARLAEAAETTLVAGLRAQNVDLVCLAGFMRIVGPALLTAYPGAILNIHPSLLPSFPGLDAQAQALAAGVKVSGCTVHFVDAGIDTGPIVLQAAVPVLDDDTATTLAARILAEEHRLYAEAVHLWAEGRLVIDGRRVRIRPAGPSVLPGAPASLRRKGQAS
jgi:phosphoribosylglycinamide formyltransferase 1